MFTGFRDSLRSLSHSVNGVLRTVSKGCKNSPKRTKYNCRKPDDKEEVKIERKKKIYQKSLPAISRRGMINDQNL